MTPGNWTETGVCSDDRMFAELWRNVERCLNSDLPRWRDRVDVLGQLALVLKREDGARWSDDQVFEGLILAVLSANTAWSKIENIRADLSDVFHGFSLQRFSQVSIADVDRLLVPWFKERKAASQSLSRSLKFLIGSARQFLNLIERFGSLESYLDDLYARSRRDPKLMVRSLGEDGTDKICGIGLALGAEFLKNVGFDVAKPDRHIKRAVASFGLMPFSSWTGFEKFKAPQATKVEMHAVMEVMETWAEVIGERVTYVDNAVWLLCAKGEPGEALHLSNFELASLRP